MNSSQPVSSFLTSVSYNFLSSKDIRALSVREITKTTTIDELANPVSGGLHSLELGQFGDNECATCGLKTPQCPGHCGHIKLPVPCYHPTFLDQTLRLLRAHCFFCRKLRMPRSVINMFVCKMRLINHGLVKELADLAHVEATFTAKEDVEEDEEQSDDAVDAVERLRVAFVKQAIKEAEEEGRATTQKSEASVEARRIIISEFLTAMNKSTRCPNCQGYSPKLRKDGYTTIYRAPLSEKLANANIQLGLKERSLVLLNAKRKRENKEKSRKRVRIEDEGVADMERSADEESEDVSSESDDMSEGDIAIGTEDVVDGEVAEKAPRQESAKGDTLLTPIDVLLSLNKMFALEQEAFGLLYGSARHGGDVEEVTADMLFIHDVLVTPNRFRPESRAGSTELNEAAENSLYNNILKCVEAVRLNQRMWADFNAGKGAMKPRNPNAVAIDLQNAVNAVIDRDRNTTRGDARTKPEGIKQKLEKKEGMFRKYMMGKRVNFAARTVISPDPNIETNEIGVPPVFAIKLTYPEPVTIWNLEELQEAVKNGPQRWPGAVAVENEAGQILRLDRKTADERLAIANQLLAPSVTTGSGAVRGSKPKKVHRHLNNGDIVIMNRQPTLHKPSMMCHRARVLPGEKTLRMHYANCNTYNADFDGDEMNMHFPQNEVARAEALSIADTDHQYLSATAGKPLRGLIQDHISICVMLTKRDTFFSREEYMQLLYAALRPENGHCTSGRLESVPPAMVKPRKLWTGKQVITSVLLNIVPAGFEGLTMKGTSQTDASNWSENSDEAIVVFKDGQHVQGILDKKQIGPSGGGFVNGVYETYGHTVAGRLLSVLGRLLTKLLHMRAHSCGVEDLVFTTSGEQKRREALADSETIGLTTAAQHVSLEDANVRATDPELKRRLEEVLRDDDKQRGLDNRMKNALSGLSSAVTKACLPSALIKSFPRNQMQLMTVTGAKGSIVNANQISCNLGQQVLEGRRVPVMVSGKTLPCFKPFETSARAGGYIVDRFLTGVRPQEFYFHAMAGREGLIDTAVKTSRSGYLQRCLIKGMEGLKVQYDSSVRDADGSVVQFLYGEDGLDVAKSKYLGDMTFTAQNYLSLWKSLGIYGNLDVVANADAAEATKTAERKYRKRGDLSASDPAISQYNPARHGGAMSEKIYNKARNYMDTNPQQLIKKKAERGESALTKHTFNTIVRLRYMRSVAEAGEAVGVVAGQSVGEPSTQMTLNTFHLAGHATKNVTLGIPRLRELVMTASASISTPTMTLRLIEEMNEDEAKQFAKAISRLSLAEILDKVTVDESIGKGSGYGQVKSYKVKLEFFPQSEYTKEYAITVADVMNTLEHQFLPLLQKSYEKQVKLNQDNKTKSVSDAMPDIGVSAGRVSEFSGNADAEREDGADDSDVDEGDATAAKSKVNRQQEGYGAFEDDGERDLARQAQDQDDVQNRDDDEAYHSQDEEEKREYADQIQARIASNKETRSIVAFSFDHDQGSYCTFTVEGDADGTKVLMLHLVEVAARQALVQSVSGIVSAIYDSAATKDTNVPHVATEGVNIPAMWQYQHIVNPHAIYTNSIHDILNIYGVEAARDAIVREIDGVFKGHSISVDARHLTLIADYMTRAGGYLPFNRLGYRSNPSPFMKMSFETTVGFLKDAVLFGDWDDLEGPSSRIVVGRINKVGTGGFDVYTDLDKQQAVETEAAPVLAEDDSTSEMSED